MLLKDWLMRLKIIFNFGDNVDVLFWKEDKWFSEIVACC